MLGKIDKWICESLLYIDFKQKEKGLYKTFRFALLLILSLTVFLNLISVNFITFVLEYHEIETTPLIQFCLSFFILFLLYKRYYYNDKYIYISNINGYTKKLWGTVIFYIIFTFVLMWVMIIYAVLSE